MEISNAIHCCTIAWSLIQFSDISMLTSLYERSDYLGINIPKEHLTLKEAPLGTFSNLKSKVKYRPKASMSNRT